MWPAVAIGPVKCGTMPTLCVSHTAMILSISVMPPTFGSDARAKSMSRCSTSGLNSALVPHSSPGASGTVVSSRSFGICVRNCSSRTGSSTQNGRYGSISLQTSTASWKSNFWCRSIIQLPSGPTPSRICSTAWMISRMRDSRIEHRAAPAATPAACHRLAPGVPRRARRAAAAAAPAARPVLGRMPLSTRYTR